jgi:protein subunit release factor A
MKLLLRLALGAITGLVVLSACSKGSNRQEAKTEVSTTSIEQEHDKQEKLIRTKAEWSQFVNEFDSTVAVTQEELESLKEIIEHADPAKQDELKKRQRELQQQLNDQNAKFTHEFVVLDKKSQESEDAFTEPMHVFKAQFRKEMETLNTSISAFIKESVYSRVG